MCMCLRFRLNPFNSNRLANNETITLIVVGPDFFHCNRINNSVMDPSSVANLRDVDFEGKCNN